MFFMVYQDMNFKLFDDLYDNHDLDKMMSYFKMVDEGILPLVVGSFRFSIKNDKINTDFIDFDNILDLQPISRSISIMNSYGDSVDINKDFHTITAVELQTLQTKLSRKLSNEVDYLKSLFDNKQFKFEFV